jgi:hypothetical protein
VDLKATRVEGDEVGAIAGSDPAKPSAKTEEL